MRKFQQYFYSQKSALYLEQSQTGVFFEIANSKGFDSEGLPVFDWQKKKTTKLSISELCHLSDSLKAYRRNYSEYFEYGHKLNWKNKELKNVQFIHKTEKCTTRCGWNVLTENNKAIISFIINNYDSQYFMTISFIDIARLDRALDRIIQNAFDDCYYSPENKPAAEDDIYLPETEDQPPDTTQKKEATKPEPKKQKKEIEISKEDKNNFALKLFQAQTVNECETLLNNFLGDNENKDILNLAAAHIELIAQRLTAYDSFEKSRTLNELELAWKLVANIVIEYTPTYSVKLENDKTIIKFFDNKYKELKGIKI